MRTLLYVGTERDVVAELALLDGDVARVDNFLDAVAFIDCATADGAVDADFLVAMGPEAATTYDPAVYGRSPFPCSDVVVAVGPGTVDDGAIWKAAFRIGANHVLELPAACTWLDTQLTREHI